MVSGSQHSSLQPFYIILCHNIHFRICPKPKLNLNTMFNKCIMLIIIPYAAWSHVFETHDHQRLHYQLACWVENCWSAGHSELSTVRDRSACIECMLHYHFMFIFSFISEQFWKCSFIDVNEPTFSIWIYRHTDLLTLGLWSTLNLSLYKFIHFSE